MADDIVTRLRSYDIGSVAHESEYHMTEVLAEAADEIERLRKAIVDYVMTVSDCYSTPATDSDALELLKQAVRGE